MTRKRRPAGAEYFPGKSAEFLLESLEAKVQSDLIGILAEELTGQIDLLRTGGLNELRFVHGDNGR
jgi:hypothetical protein